MLADILLHLNTVFLSNTPKNREENCDSSNDWWWRQRYVVYMWVRKQQQDGDGNKDDNDGVSVGSDLFVRNTRHSQYRNTVAEEEEEDGKGTILSSIKQLLVLVMIVLLILVLLRVYQLEVTKKDTSLVLVRGNDDSFDQILEEYICIH